MLQQLHFYVLSHSIAFKLQEPLRLQRKNSLLRVHFFTCLVKHMNHTSILSDVESPITSRISGRVDASRVALLVAWGSFRKETQPLWTILSYASQNFSVTDLSWTSTLMDLQQPQLSELKTNHEPYCKAYWYSKHYCNLNRYCITSFCLPMLTVNLMASIEYYLITESINKLADCRLKLLTLGILKRLTLRPVDLNVHSTHFSYFGFNTVHFCHKHFLK